MISVEQAQRLILNNTLPLKETELAGFSSSLGRISSCDIRAKEDIPPFDNSAMDGFAVKAKDLSGASRENPINLEVVEDLPAGYTAKRLIRSGQAIRIMTGAPLPKGADAVVMVEDTEPSSVEKCHSDGAPKGRPKNLKREILRFAQNDMNTETRVKIFKEVKSGENVRYAGEDVKKGDVVIKKGTILKSGHIGMLASLGVTNIKVYRRPKIAILATGDELVEVRQRLKPGKIRNSNSYSLYAQVLRLPAIPLLLGIAKDNKKEIEQKIRKGLRADMLLVSGGVSVGDYDFVKDVMIKLGRDIHPVRNVKEATQSSKISNGMKFWKVAMRPGKPLAFGKIGRVPVFGLPGNPVSSMIAFEQFVRPAILKLAGTKDLFRFYLPAIAKEDFDKKKGLRYFLRIVLENQNGTLYAYLTGPQGSGILKSMVIANGIMELPEDVSEVRAGEKVQVTYLD